MGVYIDQAYLTEVVGEQTLRIIISARLTTTGAWALTDAEVVAAISRAVASAEAIADSKLGRRFTADELAGLEEEDVIKQAVARIAAYELAPSTMPRSEELRADRDRQCSLLKDIGKRECAAGRSDPDPPALTASNINTLEAAGLDYIARV